MSDRHGAAVCSGCRAPLPDGAMFCGECGRSVSQATVAVATGVTPATGAERCERCGAELHPDDIFCGECGHVAGSILRAFSAGRDTAVIAPVVPERGPTPERGPVPEPGPTTPARTPEPVRPDPVRPDSESPDSVTPEAAAHAPGGFRRRVRPHHLATERTGTDDDHDDVEATRIVPPRGRGDRFVLQFSTGETITVYGTGLIGRNPVPEPGEYFDQFVRVFDPTRSVSKTHIEFGQDGGAFWVRDRYSGNGTVLREPDSPAKRCEPGKRYPVMRGGRLDLGEQFLVVS